MCFLRVAQAEVIRGAQTSFHLGDSSLLLPAPPPEGWLLQHGGGVCPRAGQPGSSSNPDALDPQGELRTPRCGLRNASRSAPAGICLASAAPVCGNTLPPNQAIANPFPA